jgi:hypothetical protein
MFQPIASRRNHKKGVVTPRVRSQPKQNKARTQIAAVTPQNIRTKKLSSTSRPATAYPKKTDRRQKVATSLRVRLSSIYSIKRRTKLRADSRRKLDLALLPVTAYSFPPAY